MSAPLRVGDRVRHRTFGTVGIVTEKPAVLAGVTMVGWIRVTEEVADRLGTDANAAESLFELVARGAVDGLLALPPCKRPAPVSMWESEGWSADASYFSGDMTSGMSLLSCGGRWGVGRWTPEWRRVTRFASRESAVASMRPEIPKGAPTL